MNELLIHSDHVRLEYRLRRADGAYRWMLASGVPRYESDGSFAGYVGCDIDITERRNAEDQVRESRAEIQSLRVFSASSRCSLILRYIARCNAVSAAIGATETSCPRQAKAGALLA